jgi:hypothetical protein
VTLDNVILTAIKVVGALTILVVLAGGFVWGVDKCLHTKPLWEITWRVMCEYWREHRKQGGDAT